MNVDVKPIRILLVDDHYVVRAGIQQMLRGSAAFNIIGGAATIVAALEYLRSESVDVIVLDISLPDGSGLMLLPMIKTEFPHCRVLIMSSYTEPQFVRSAIDSGADGYLDKVVDIPELTAAIHQVMAGRKYWSSSIVLSLAEAGRLKPASLFAATLAARENQILKPIVRGQSLTQIGLMLDLSVKTVSTYRTRIMRKAGLTSNAELILFGAGQHMTHGNDGSLHAMVPGGTLDHRVRTPRLT